MLWVAGLKEKKWLLVIFSQSKLLLDYSSLLSAINSMWTFYHSQQSLVRHDTRWQRFPLTLFHFKQIYVITEICLWKPYNPLKKKHNYIYCTRKESKLRGGRQKSGLHLKQHTRWKVAFEPRLEKRSYVNHKGARVKILQKRKGQVQRLKYSWAVSLSVIANEPDRGHCCRHCDSWQLRKAARAAHLAVLACPIIFCILFICLFLFVIVDLAALKLTS